MPHIHDKIDFCSETFIVYKDTVLLRKHDKLKIWLGVGGHIELDEDSNQAAIREVREEVGLDVVLYCEEGRQPSFENNKKSLIPPYFLNRHNITGEHEHVAFVYFAKSSTNILKLSSTETTDGCKWFTKAELIKNEHNIPNDIQFCALKALEKLSEK
jgi:8-oxo-dGTP pyrophosphatase MutT (NUDIX family)